MSLIHIDNAVPKTSIRRNHAFGRLGDALARSEARFQLEAITLPFQVIVPAGPTGFIFSDQTLVVGTSSNPPDGYPWDPIDNDIVVFPSVGRADVIPTVQATVLGSPGVVNWTFSGDIHAPGGFNDPPLISLTWLGTSTNQTDQFTITGMYTTPTFPGAGSGGRARLSHDAGVAITIDLRQFLFVASFAMNATQTSI